MASSPVGCSACRVFGDEPQTPSGIPVVPGYSARDKAFRFAGLLALTGAALGLVSGLVRSQYRHRRRS